MPPELPKVCSSTADCYKIQFAVTDASIAPALDAVVAFFDALRAEQWDAAADMVDADAAAAFRAAELASLTGWAQHRDAMIAARERGESMGWSSGGRLNQALLDQYRDTPIRGMPGAARQAVGAFAHVRARRRMTSRLSYSLGLALCAGRLNAQLPKRVHTSIDSVVLVRTAVPGWPCPTCPPTRVVLRRDAIDSTTLAAFKQKADSIGFDDLPANVMGVSFCRVVRSDASWLG